MAKKKRKAVPNESPGEKIHYEKLISFFKWLIGVFVVVVGFTAYVIDNSLSEFKSGLEQEVTVLRDQINRMEEQVNYTLDKSEQRADKELVRVRQDAYEIMQFTRDVTTTQIDVIREDAKNLALSSAKSRVEQAFADGNINELVQRTAEGVVAEKLESLVELELDEIRVVFDYVPRMTTLFDQITHGNRGAFDELDSLANLHENSVVNEMATDLLLQKGKDYEQDIFVPGSYEYRFQDVNLQPLADSLLFEKLNEIPTERHYKNMAKGDRVNFLSETIKNSEDLYEVGVSFILLRREIDKEIQTFDMRAFRKWYDSQ